MKQRLRLLAYNARELGRWLAATASYLFQVALVGAVLLLFLVGAHIVAEVAP